MRSQFVLDDRTEQLLNELASARAGNRSFVVREAIHLYASVEGWLDTVEADPGLQQMMADSLADIESGNVMSSRQLLELRTHSSRRILGGASDHTSRKQKKVGRGVRVRKAGARP
jgi:predicted transcriptional regulator